MAFRRTLGMLIFLLIILSSESGVVRHPEKQLLSLRTTPHEKSSSSYYASLISKNNRATVLEVKHRDFYKGPFGSRNRQLQNRLIADKLRVQSIQNQIRTKLSGQESLSSSQTGIPITPGIKLQTLNYIVTATFGNQNLTVIVDTGSDLTWVQCQPCSSCYSQSEPLLNPSISLSYNSIPCNSSSCQSLEFATGYSGQCGTDSSSCNYVVSYGDGSYTRGELGKDNLVLGSVKIESFVFGCGRNNKGLFGLASGLMGLGRSDLSLIYQTFDTFEGVFSYCLPSTESNSSGSLIFGYDITMYRNSTPVSYTRMILNPRLMIFYFLNLTGITIGSEHLQVSNFDKNKILIDSGTVITRLWPSMYRAVKSEFLKQFSGYPTAPGFSILDTCFNLSTYEEVNIPTITMLFEGEAELEVDLNGVFYFVKKDASQVCLALASLAYEDELGIIGNYQQRNTRVIYDIKESKLGFARETCNF